jgi:hypothetical protein
VNNKKNNYIGKKILYALVIAISGLLVLFSMIGVIGVWLVERPLSDSAVTILSVVEETTGTVRASIARIDQPLAALEAETTEIEAVSQQLSQNVTDKGLVMVLLPEEKAQQFKESASSVLETYYEIRDTITKGLELYRSIDRLPFISLPGLNEDQVGKITTSMDKIDALVQTLRSGIADVRAGVAEAIGKVEEAARLVKNEIIQVREALALLDSRLAALEALLIRLQQVIPGVLLAVAVILSLFLVFIIFTQVEVIRLYIARWRLLGQPEDAPSVDAIPQPAQTQEGNPESE